jgi:hypothetical protein
MSPRKTSLARWFSCLIALLMVITAIPAAAQPEPAPPAKNFYVATWGDADVTWQTNSQSNPFLTLDQARQQVALFKAAVGFAFITVYIAGGEYPLTQPVVFGPSDSGWGGNPHVPIKYVAWNPNRPGMNDNDDVLFTGGVRLNGWTQAYVLPDGTPVWTCIVPPGIPEPRDLFVNNMRWMRARFPNPPDPDYVYNNCRRDHWTYPVTGAPAEVPIPPCPSQGHFVVETVQSHLDPSTGKKYQYVRVKPDPQMDPQTGYTVPPEFSGVNWSNVEVVAHSDWTAPRQRVTLGNLEDPNRIELLFEVQPWIPNSAWVGSLGIFDWEQPTRWFGYLGLQGDLDGSNSPNQVILENDVKFIDLPYEWSYDRHCRRIHMALCDNPNATDVRVVVPVAEQLLILDRVSYLRFEGIDWTHTYYSPKEADPAATFGYTTLQAGLPAGVDPNFARNVLTPAIEFRGALYCVLASCRVAYSGGSGVWITTSENPGTSPQYLESHHNQVYACEIFDINGHGVLVGDQYARWEGHQTEHRTGPSIGNEVFDCYIHHIGGMYKDAAAIYVGHVADCLIATNYIHSVNWSGISSGTFWGHQWPVDGPAPQLGHPRCPAKRPWNNLGVFIYANHIHNTMLRLVDGGGIYCVGGHGPWNGIPSMIMYNYVHDIIVNPFLNGGSHVKGIQFDSGSSSWWIANNYVKYTRRPFQFNSHGGAAANPPSEASGFGKAVWPVTHPEDPPLPAPEAWYECPPGSNNSGYFYKLPGMQWSAGDTNFWHNPLNRPQGWLGMPWAKWEEAFGHTAVPLGTVPGNAANIKILTTHVSQMQDPAIEEAVDWIIAQTHSGQAFLNWESGVKRIHRQYPVALGCPESGMLPSPDPSAEGWGEPEEPE